MKDRFSEDDVITIVTRLTRSQLFRFIEFDLVKPQRAESGHLFRPIDIARLELLCDLSEDLDLDESALGVVTSLLDQLHAARTDLATLASAIDTLPADLRSAVMANLQRP
jgi:chaperone modulatory protein CbpM